MKIISAVLITGAVFVLFLYSPVGSPELYRPADYATMIINPGVSITPGATGSSRSKGSSSYTATALPSATGTSAKRKLSSQASSGEASSFGQSAGSASNVFQTSRNVSTSSGGGMLFSGGSGASASGRSSGNNSGASSYGFMALATDASPFISKTSAAPATLFDGGTDPGEDPTGDPIPVTDGWGFLLMMAAGYAVFRNWKMKKLEIGK